MFVKQQRNARTEETTNRLHAHRIIYRWGESGGQPLGAIRRVKAAETVLGLDLSPLMILNSRPRLLPRCQLRVSPKLLRPGVPAPSSIIITANEKLQLCTYCVARLRQRRAESPFSFESPCWCTEESGAKGFRLIRRRLLKCGCGGGRDRGQEEGMRRKVPMYVRGKETNANVNANARNVWRG